MNLGTWVATGGGYQRKMTAFEKTKRDIKSILALWQRDEYPKVIKFLNDAGVRITQPPSALDELLRVKTFFCAFYYPGFGTSDSALQMEMEMVLLPTTSFRLLYRSGDDVLESSLQSAADRIGVSHQNSIADITCCLLMNRIGLWRYLFHSGKLYRDSIALKDLFYALTGAIATELGSGASRAWLAFLYPVFDDVLLSKAERLAWDTQLRGSSEAKHMLAMRGDLKRVVTERYVDHDTDDEQSDTESGRDHFARRHHNPIGTDDDDGSDSDSHAGEGHIAGGSTLSAALDVALRAQHVVPPHPKDKQQFPSLKPSQSAAAPPPASKSVKNAGKAKGFASATAATPASAKMTAVDGRGKPPASATAPVAAPARQFDIKTQKAVAVASDAKTAKPAVGAVGAAKSVGSVSGSGSGSGSGSAVKSKKQEEADIAASFFGGGGNANSKSKGKH